MFRSGFLGGGSVPRLESLGISEERRVACISRVTMAVCVTLIGIIVFFTGASRTTCAASATRAYDNERPNPKEI